MANARRFPLLVLPLLLLLATTTACEGGNDPAPADEIETAPGEMGGMMQGTEGMQASDTTRMRAVYDEIGEHYQEMMAAYDGQAVDPSPEARQLYERMQQHYRQVTPQGQTGQGMMGRDEMSQGMMGQGMMGGGSMGRHMMAMQGRGAWMQQMLELHQQMARIYAQDGYEEMADMHEQMTELYREALEGAASGRP